MYACDFFNSVCLDGCHPLVVKEIEEACASVSKQFPSDVLQRINIVVGDTKNPEAVAEYNHRKKTVQINRKYAADIKTFQNAYTRYGDGWHPVNLNSSAVIAHELGHAIAHYFSDAFAFSTHTQFTYWVQDFVLKSCGICNTVKDIKENVSEYATTNSDEWFAEAFSEFVCSSSPRIIAATLKEEVAKMFKLSNSGLSFVARKRYMGVAA